MPKRVAIGSDHAGYRLKEFLKRSLPEWEFCDVGTDSPEPCDYPDFAAQVARLVASGECDCGIIICGTGVGSSIAANKVPGVRAALCHDVYSAEMSRLHNDANVLALGGRVVGEGLALRIVRAWLETPFSGEERHRRRLAKLQALERATL